MRRKELIAFEALLMGLVVEMGNDRYRFDENHELCCGCLDMLNNNEQVWFKMDCSFRYFIETCQTRMTDEQYWGLVGDIGLNKADTKNL